MKLKTLFSVGFLVFFGLFVSCGVPSPVQTFVPDDAIFVVELKNPVGFLSGSGKFLESFSEKNTRKISDIFNEWEKQSHFPLDALDLSKPAGAALLKVSQDGTQTQAIAFFALKDPGKNYEKVKNFLKDNKDLQSLLSGDYVVLFLGFDKTPVYPVAHPLDAAKIKTPVANGVESYLNLASLEKALLPEGESWDEITQQVSQALEVGPNKIPGADVLVKQLVGYVRDLRGFSFALGMDARGISLWSRTDLKPESPYVAAAKNLSVKGSREFWKYQAANALFSTSWNVPAETLQSWSTALSVPLWKSMGASDALVTKFTAAQKDMLASIGPRGAISFDLDFDPHAFGEAFSKGTPDAPALLKAFDLRVWGVQEVKDGESYRQALQKFYASSILHDLSAEMTKNGSVGTDLRIVVEKDKKDQDFDYDQASLWVRLQAKNAKDGSLENMNGFLEKLLEGLPVYMHYTGNRLYYVMGRTGLQDLKMMVRKDAVADSWKDSKTIQAWGDLLPDNAMMSGHFSFNRVLTLLKKSGLPQVSQIPDIAGYPDFVGSLNPTGDGNWEGGAYLSLAGDAVAVNYLATNMGLMRQGPDEGLEAIPQGEGQELNP